MNERQEKRCERRWSKGIAVLLSAVLAIPASATWQDRSDELPGMSSIRSAVLLGAAIGGGLVLTTYLLKGRGRSSSPRIDVSPSEMNHGRVSNGEHSQQQLTIRNTSGAPVILESIGISGKGFRFASQPAYPITLQTGKTVTVPVNFVPPSTGKFSGSVEVRAAGSEGKSKKWNVSLRGRGL